MLNKLQLIGFSGSDPEIKVISENNKVAKFSFATSETYKNKKGEKETKTEWHHVVFFGKITAVIEQFVKKGSKLYIEGKITYRSYEKDGQTKYFTEIVGKELKLLDSKQNNNPAQNTESNNFIEDVSDLPF